MTFVMPCEQEVEECNYGTFEPRPMLTVVGEKAFQTRLADVGGNKQVDAESKIVAFLEEFVEEDDDEGGDDELNDEEKASASTEVAWFPI